MAEETGALAMIPPGDQYDNLRFALQRLKEDFPDKYESLSNQKARLKGWVEEIDSSDGRDADQIRDDIVQHVIGYEDAKEKYGITQEEFDQLVLGGNEGGLNFGDLPETTPTGREGEEDALTLLESPTARWLQDSDTGLFYIEYTLPGGSKIAFEAEQEQIDAMFPSGAPPNAQKFDFDRYIRGDAHFGGNVSEIAGDGNFDDEVQRVISLAIDQRDLPEWVKGDPAALDALYVMVTEDRTEEWFYEEISQLESFKKRYPAVSELESRGLSIPDAIQTHVEFEANLKQLHAAAGFNSEAITPDIVGNLIQRGYSVKQVGESYSVWKRMRDHAPAMKAFNQILEANGMKPIQGQKAMFEFLSGNAPAEVYDLYEASSIQEAATASGLGDLFEADDALSLASFTEGAMTRNEAFEKFSNVAAQALRFRHQLNLQQYDLSIDDLVDLQFGRQPSSGKSAAEVGEIMARISQQAEGFLKQKATPFFGFTESGRPQARSFGELRQESV